VTEAEASPPTRIASLDVIRGVAVMGIFSVNVMSFAMIGSAYLNPTAFGGHTGASLIVWGGNLLLIDGKMRSLFSILFGASMMVVVERAQAKGQSAWWTHARRMAVLFAFGLVHYTFIWFGDILTNYALAGLVIFLFRRQPPRTLITLGVAAIIVQSLFFAWQSAEALQVQMAAHAPGASKAAVDAWNRMAGFYHPDAARIAKDQMRHLGPWSAMFERRVGRWDTYFTYLALDLPATIGLMLIGMAGFKSGFLTGSWSDGRYRRFAAWAIPAGLAGFLAILMFTVHTRFDGVALEGSVFLVGGEFAAFMALGYAALIILLTRKRGQLTDRIAAAGRCAFSNYLGTSILATFVFDGWGLGLYASLTRWQVWLVAPLFWAIMLLWSKPWLERFHYGPFEWAWRSLSRWSIQPFRKIKPVVGPVGI